LKCIRCEKDCTLKERSDGKCPHCGGLFALEPRGKHQLTDGLFQGAVKAVSAEGKVRWNLENLYYEVCRKKGLLPSLNFSAGCFGYGCLCYLASPFLTGTLEHSLMAFGALAIIGFAIREAKAPGKLLARETFNKEWSRWAEVHGTPASMIVPRNSPAVAAKAGEEDLADYSFDRAVICDSPQTVDLLLANNFHFENNCAVLTADGYPPQAFDQVKAMLTRNPRLKVWVLHDATPVGCRLAYRLSQDPSWFAEGATIIDVGLRPSNAQALKKMWVPSKKAVPEHPALSEEERLWLSKHSLALAAIRPEQVIKRLFRSFSSDQSEWGSSGGIFFVDSTSFSSDASTSDGGGDSFG
jgi:DNA-directed RNA polymerase subunit RPC12/RpoP